MQIKHLHINSHTYAHVYTFIHRSHSNSCSLLAIIKLMDEIVHVRIIGIHNMSQHWPTVNRTPAVSGLIAQINPLWGLEMTWDADKQ